VELILRAHCLPLTIPALSNVKGWGFLIVPLSGIDSGCILNKKPSQTTFHEQLRSLHRFQEERKETSYAFVVAIPQAVTRYNRYNRYNR